MGGCASTLFPYYDFARAIAGGRADVTLLLAPGREAHSFEPTPLDAVTISRADVFIYNGGEGEVWADDMLDAVGEDIGTVLRMMDFVDAREEEFSEGMTTTTSFTTMRSMTMTTAMRSSTTNTSGRRRKTPSGSAASSPTRSARRTRKTRISTARTARTTARSLKLSTRTSAPCARTPCAIC